MSGVSPKKVRRASASPKAAWRSASRRSPEGQGGVGGVRKAKFFFNGEAHRTQRDAEVFASQRSNPLLQAPGVRFRFVIEGLGYGEAWSAPLAVTERGCGCGRALSLTPALSRWERENVMPLRAKAVRQARSHAEPVTPSPGGRGLG